MTRPVRRTNWLTGFLAVLYYEFLWNLRKKKTVGVFLIVFVIVTLFLALPPLLAYYAAQPQPTNPNFVTNSFAGLSGIFLFLIAVATTMNTFSGEFETGTITPLLTKPVSRNLVFIAKVVAAIITLLAAYSFLSVYIVIGAVLTEGPQNNLPLVPLGIIGLTLGTMVWASFVIFLGTISKSSIVAALGSFGIWIGLTIIGGVLAATLGQTSVLYYAPGSGPTASTSSCEPSRFGERGSETFATGTDNLGFLLMKFVQSPNLIVNFCGFRFSGPNQTFLLASDSIATVVARSLGVTVAYIAILIFLSWYAFRRAQITESS